MNEEKLEKLRGAMDTADKATDGAPYPPRQDPSRPFTNKLYFSSTAYWSPEVYAFLRTHFDDSAGLDPWTEESLNIVRTFLKNVHMDNTTAGKSAMAQLLIRCFKRSDSYQSFACLMANAMGNKGEASAHQWDNPAWSCSCPTSHKRQFVTLMDIVFDKVGIARTLYPDGCNIYRLAHCMTEHGTGSKTPLLYALFTFLLQTILTLYVVVFVIQHFTDVDAPSINVMNLPVAIMTSVVAYVILRNEVNTYGEIHACGFWKKWTYMHIFDFISNVWVPLLLVPVGFILIIISETYVDCVLNGMSLFFIAEIDELLPEVLGFEFEDVVRKYLIDEAMCEFDDFFLDKKEIEEDPEVPLLHDMFLTSRGTAEVCEPFEIVAEKKKGMGHCIVSNRFITTECVFTKIEFKLAEYKEFPGSQEQINWLRLTSLNERTKPLEFNLQEPLSESPVITLTGFFIITTFEMSRRVIKMRVTGSPDSGSFLEALDYFQLWEIEPHAEKLLDKKRTSGGHHKNILGWEDKRKHPSHNLHDHDKEEEKKEK